jgi:hypothetical protein
MADRTWITMTSPTPLIFRYHLPLKDLKNCLISQSPSKNDPMCIILSLYKIWSQKALLRQCHTLKNVQLASTVWERSDIGVYLLFFKQNSQKFICNHPKTFWDLIVLMGLIWFVKKLIFVNFFSSQVKPLKTIKSQNVFGAWLYKRFWELHV